MPWPKGKPRSKVQVQEPMSDSVEAAEEVTSAIEPAPVVDPAPAIDDPEPFRSRVEMTAEALGRLANHLLGNPSVDAAFDRAIAAMQGEWSATLPTETDKREALYFRVKAVEDLKYHLGRIDADGKRVRAKAERIQRVA